MSFGYVELELALDSAETLIFDIKEDDGQSQSLSSYSNGTCSITNIDTQNKKTIGSVGIEPDGIVGRIKVSIAETDMLSSDDFFTFDDTEDEYGHPTMRYALSVKLDNEVKIRAKTRIVKVG